MYSAGRYDRASCIQTAAWCVPAGSSDHCDRCQLSASERGASDFWFQCETVYIGYYCTGIKAGWRQAFDLQCHDRDDFKLYRDYGCPDDVYQ